MVQSSNYIFPLLTLPYLLRVLGVDNFAVFSISQAVTQYFILLTTYGFNLTSTKEISISRHSQQEINVIFSSTILAKLILCLISYIILVIIINFVDDYADISIPLYLSFIRVIGEVIFPIWLYQGLEKLNGMAISTTIAKFIIFICTFIFVRQSEDLQIAILIQSLSVLLSGILSYYFIFRYKLVTGFCFSVKDVCLAFKRSFPVFISSSFSSFYMNLNVIVLGFYASPEIVANFSAADKLRLAVQNVLSPVSQAVFPRVSYQTNNGESVSSLLKTYGLPFILFGFTISSCIFFIGEKVASIYFGAEYALASKIFYYMFPLPFIISVAMVFGFWILIPRNKGKFLPYIYGIGAICHLSYLYIMIKHYSYIGVTLSIIMTELMITIALIAFVCFLFKPFVSAGGKSNETI